MKTGQSINTVVRMTQKLYHKVPLARDGMFFVLVLVLFQERAVRSADFLEEPSIILTVLF